ncbi:tetratricopeptide repeat protein [Nocardia sp. alder85J]|uniref:tetratricopeptide repeat protein n=1 Tax=Nocardia sp. alder85J TaxID=2862949 RepID=UPI00224E5696|nr:tetratricopeptide repeat protein [Nocardia sp. alder85J]MCX4091965.1 tetratricopeptide repeat protein [Nocardia sp. alder85J]
MRWDRVVGVSGAESGSGYVIAPRLVLTSAHVTGADTSRVTVFRPGRVEIFTATVVWRGVSAHGTDAALAEVDDPDWPEPEPGPVVWGRTVTHEPGIRCITWGLPEFAQRTGHPLEVAQSTGILNPGDGYVGDRYVVKLDGFPPDDGTASPWRGISGAAVFCGDLLTGVVAADSAHLGHSALVAVPVYLLLHDPGFRAAVTPYGLGIRCESVELQELMDQQSPLRATAARTPAGLLTARRAVVPFHGRDQLLTGLRDWAAEPGIGMWLLHGSGGQGKTRLAHFFGEELAAAGWAVLWLDSRADRDRLRRAGQVVGAPLLVIVDYAEIRTRQLADLFDALTGRPGGTPVKVLLLARVGGEWLQHLSVGSDSAAEILSGVRTTALEPLDTTAAARRETYRDAIRAFAAALPALDVPGPADTDWTGVADAVAARPVPEFGSETTVLGVQMAALVELLDATVPTAAVESAGLRGLEDQVLAHEYRHWDTNTDRGVAKLGLATLKDLIAVTIVLKPQTFEDLDAVLTRVPEVAAERVVPSIEVRDWLTSLYPGQTAGVFGGLAPDRLAEQLVGRLMLDRTRPCLIETVATSGTLTETETEHLLSVCVRAAAHHTLTPAAGERLTAWCTNHPNVLMPAAIRVATHVEAPAPLLAAFDHLTSDPDVGTTALAQLYDSFPDRTQVLAPVAASVARALVERRRRTSPTSEDRSLLAGSLNNLAIRLGTLGRHEEGLAAATEAVDLYRALAADDPGTYLPDLAAGLNNLAVPLGEMDRREEGLRGATEAVDIYRTLAADDPDAYLPKVAMSVSNLVVDLRDAHQRDKRLAAATEAVDLYRKLAADDPGTYLPDLAAGLNNLAVPLSETGRRAEGLGAATEAVELYRKLAADNPDAYRPDLAASLNNRAVQLGGVNRRDDQLMAATEAVELYRTLAAGNPGAHLPSLAMTVTNLAAALGETGRRKEGRAAATEAVDLYRRLAEHNPPVAAIGMPRAQRVLTRLQE